VEAVAELRCTINGGEGGKLDGAVTGRGKVRRRSSGWRRCLHGVVVEAEGRQAVGNSGTVDGRWRKKGAGG
jgi:hypothetical protein